MLLTLIFFVLFVSLIIMFFLSINQIEIIRRISLYSSTFVFLLSLLLLISFNFNKYHFQSLLSFSIDINFFNISLLFGIDGLSIYFFVLTCLLMFLCILFLWKDINSKEQYFNLILLELVLLLVFTTLDLFLFYIFFEAVLIPMFLVIGVFGSRSRKIRAAYLLFFYTLIGSVLMLIGVLYIYSKVGSSNYELIQTYNFTILEQKWLWLAFFISFSSKIPMFPFHIWLPEAHVEAPTVGSVILAGILLKLGVYGFIRFSLVLFPDSCVFFSPIIYLLSIIGIIYASLTAIRQTDIKRIIAYSSIAHMNLVVLGIFSFNVMGLQGAIFQSLSHGFVAGGMFLLVGILYDRYHSRLLHYYGGIVHVMPIYSFFFLAFTLANIAVPGTSSFVGEFLLLCGLYKTNIFVCILAGLGVILCAIYSLWLYNRIIFGNLKIVFTKHFYDITLREFIILSYLFLIIIFFGCNPSYLLSGIQIFTTGFIELH
jgi:NADH-quinone oxidoreductase subunit M